MKSRIAFGGLFLLLLLSMLFLYLWQFLIDPRFADSSDFKGIADALSKAIYGEHCRDIYKITNRADAINYAKAVWKVDAGTWKASDEKGYNIIFNSESFRESPEYILGRKARNVTFGEAGPGDWDVSYEFFQHPTLVASFTITFSKCGRIVDLKRLHYYTR
jgi:hypothetical protein